MHGGFRSSAGRRCRFFNLCEIVLSVKVRWVANDLGEILVLKVCEQRGALRMSYYWGDVLLLGGCFII